MSCGLFKRGSTSVRKDATGGAVVEQSAAVALDNCAISACLPRRPQLLLGQIGGVEVWRASTFNAVLALLSAGSTAFNGCRGRFFMEETETCPPSL